MKLSLAILVICASSVGCASVIATGGSGGGATESSLIQADRDFAVATHARGIDGWMSFYASDAIRVRYRDNMVKGYDEVRRFDLPNISDTTVTLNWEPTDAYVFHDRSIGSTTGRYWIVSRRTVDAGKELQRGRYVTMWRRDRGRWLVIMDTGYPEPAAPTANKNPVPLWGTGLATGGPPVLQAQPVAPSCRAGGVIPDFSRLDSPYGKRV